ncbi:Zn-binding domain-containing protein [Tsukamurella soli]|uniref:Zn-binding domain-containing protein n=1 Tax=Tsukamurella soli TaxID=644556 RepID=UPI003608951E
MHWLVLTDAGDEFVDEDEETLAEKQVAAARSGLKWLCTGCGALGADGCADPGCADVQQLRVREHPRKSSVMSTCTECGARAYQVIRRLRTDQNAAPAVLTTALYTRLPAAGDDAAADLPGGGRKLLAFSDSRQQAAFAAPYLERTYSRALERRLLVDVLRAHAGAELSPDDMAGEVRLTADGAGLFARHATDISRRQEVNPWVTAELIAMDQRQSLEGLGLLAVRLVRTVEIPRAFTQLGLTTDQVWSLLDELVRTLRLQGAVTPLNHVDIADDRFAPRNRRVSIRTSGPDPKKGIISWKPGGKAGTTNARLLLVRKVLGRLAAEALEDRMLEAAWKLLVKAGHIVEVAGGSAGVVYQVDHRMLRMTAGGSVSWFRCAVCRRLTPSDLHGVCPYGPCGGTVEPYEVPPLGDDTNHYRVLYRTLREAPLTAREHTAQLTSAKAAEVQREFIEGKVNVLSCSTTFELGVDVGDLQSVMLRNMPPRTANYVQRAGRAGRRTGSAAFVLTYARRNSHDLTQYASPETMIAGRMRIPWVPVGNLRIGRRHAHSVALAAYFRHCADAGIGEWRKVGEFFAPEDGTDSPASRVAGFLSPVPDGIRAALGQILPEATALHVDVAGDGWVAELADLLAKAEAGVRHDLDVFTDLQNEAVAAKKYQVASALERAMNTVRARDLIGFLANHNVLPKYGFPVDTVEMSTAHCDQAAGRDLDLSRDLSQAIFDYAPGSQVVAGGWLWTSRGLQKVPKRALPRYHYRICEACGRFSCDVGELAETQCETCGESASQVLQMVIPEFGFIADRRVEPVGSDVPQRVWGGSSYLDSPGAESAHNTWPPRGRKTVDVRASTAAWMAVVADAGGRGFRLCNSCGWAEVIGAATKGGAAKAKSDAHDHPVTGRTCDGIPSRVSLAHRYQTDIAEFTFPRDVVSYHRDAEARWHSALFALLEGASEALEIARDDIDGTLAWSGEQRSIVLFDTVPGGAGAAAQIAARLPEVLDAAHARVARCECGPETSCYGCLRSHRNGRVHDRLSRAGALEVLEHLGVGGRSDRGRNRPWGHDLSDFDDGLANLLAELHARGVCEPEIGAECGRDNWPVVARWAGPGVVLVDATHVDRDADLAASGFRVFHAADSARDIADAISGAAPEGPV